MRRIRQHLSYANVMVTILAFIVLGGGSAVALSGRNAVQSNDIGPGAQVKKPDVAANAIVSRNIKNRTVSVRDTKKVIPSGATITGAFNELEDNTGSASPANLQFGVSFYGLRAPQPLTSADVKFDDVGISAAAAAAGQESSDCTGGIGIPTAPPGKVCIYLFLGGVANDSAYAGRLGFASGFTQADDKGFVVGGFRDNLANLGGTWAYTAP